MMTLCKLTLVYKPQCTKRCSLMRFWLECSSSLTRYWSVNFLFRFPLLIGLWLYSPQMGLNQEAWCLGGSPSRLGTPQMHFVNWQVRGCLPLFGDVKGKRCFLVLGQGFVPPLHRRTISDYFPTTSTEVGLGSRLASILVTTVNTRLWRLQT